MNILRRWLGATKEATPAAAASARNPRMEMTVERETITLLVRRQAEKNETKPTGETSSTPSERRFQSPPAPAPPAMDRE